MKLKKNITMMLLLVSILPLAIFGLFSFYETNKKINSMAEYNLRAVSANQIANIENFAKDRRNEMEMVAHYNLTVDAIKGVVNSWKTKRDRSYLDDLLRERKEYKTYVASISVLDQEFHVVGSSEKYEIRELSQLKDTDKKFHTGEFIMGNVYERETDNGKKKLVPAYIGVYEDDELIGYIAEELDTAYFDELRLNMDSLADGTFYILDGNGAIITAGDTTQKESINNFKTTSKQREDFQKKWNAIDHEKNPTGEIRYRYGNQEYITFYSDLENTDWSIRVTENLTQQRGRQSAYNLFIILMLCTFVIGVVAVQFFVARKISLPIQNAMEAFEVIQSTQDYSVRLNVNTQDEFGELAQGINRLLDYIETEKIHDKAMQRKLEFQAESDPLTGIKNKRAIENTILDMVMLSTEKGDQITLGFLDVDHFKDFNTKYGHQMGDEVLKFVAKTLQSTLNGEAGRMGGDEFIFCYVGNRTMEEIEAAMQKLVGILRKGCPRTDGEGMCAVPCSIGVVTTSGKNLDYTEMVREADKAMYDAKNAGRDTFVINKIL